LPIATQVLTILDGTADSWPGVAQAVSDLDVLTGMATARTGELEMSKAALGSRVSELESKNDAMMKALAGALQHGQAERV